MVYGETNLSNFVERAVCVNTLNISVGEGRLRVGLNAVLTGRGINILLTGGESPHVGAVVLCVPRPSDTGKGITSDTWVVPVPGHKDFEVARLVGELVARECNQITAVTAGIHLDNAAGWEIDEIRTRCLAAGQQLVERISKQRGV